MLERAHRLGPLKLAAIVAALLTAAGALGWALSRDGGAESSPEAARNPVQSESSDTRPSTDAGTNRNGAARESGSGGQNGQEPEPSSRKAAKHPLEGLLPGSGGDRVGGRSQ